MSQTEMASVVPGLWSVSVKKKAGQSHTLRLLFVIAHCFHPFGRGPYGSHQKDPHPRMMALTACLSSLREVFGGPQYLIRHGSRTAVEVNQKQRGVVDIIVCTTGAFHLLDQIPLPKDYYCENVPCV